jgi:hypothetical protein
VLDAKGVLQSLEPLVTLQIECSAGYDEDKAAEIPDVIHKPQDRLPHDAIAARYFANSIHLIDNQDR